MSAQSDVDLNREEILLRVPKDIALLPLGFAIDSGGSITKLLYRSKEDYSNGKRIAKVDDDDGILRLRHLATEDGDDVIRFLQEHCDVMETAKTESEKSWFVMGLNARHFRKKLEETMNIKVKILSEMLAINSGLKSFYGAPLLQPQLRPLSLSEEAVGHALRSTRDFIQMMNSAGGGGGGGGGGDGSFDELKQLIDPVAVGLYVMKLMTTDAATLNREFSGDEVIEWPCLNVICGSAAGMIVMKDGGGFEIGSFLPVAGKTFVGMGRLLCGAKDFAELIEMAARGDSRKVDVMASDLKVTADVIAAGESDWYNNLPDTLVTYSMGKLAENAASESFSKDDLAAGLLNAICCGVARTTVAVAKQMKVKCVVFDGSLVNSALVRCTLQKWLLFDSLIQPLMGEKSLKWIFLPYPGFVCAFGTWHQNWELHKGGHAEK